MPDRTTKVEVNAESGTFRAVVPVQSAREPPADTQIGVDPGTSEHELTIRDVSHEEAMPEPELLERRKQAQLNVNVQQPFTGGLTGWRAQMANMTFGGVIVVAFFLMYRDSQQNQKEWFAQMREDSKQIRADAQSRDAATVIAISGLTASNSAMVSEFRLARQDIGALVKILTEKKPPEPETQGTAPMPRAKTSGAG